jgi:hypothetical protein
MTLPLPEPFVGEPQSLRDLGERAQRNFEVIAQAFTNTLRWKAGTCPAFTWSGTNQTNLAITHGLGITPQFVICGNARYGDAIAADARAPWVVVAGAYTSTTFTAAMRTLNNGGIGAFAVAAGAFDWIAFG